jgi:hypothetical protein
MTGLKLPNDPDERKIALDGRKGARDQSNSIT